MAIIEYDHSPNISPEQRLRSLADSVRRAFEEIESDIKSYNHEAEDDSKEEIRLGAVATEDVVPIKKGGTEAETAAAARQNINFIGTNPISSVSEDTTANWVALGTGIAGYNTPGMITDQPSQYGILVNRVYGNTIFQKWYETNSNGMWYRRGSGDSWGSTWIKVFDENSLSELEDLLKIDYETVAVSTSYLTSLTAIRHGRLKRIRGLTAKVALTAGTTYTLGTLPEAFRPKYYFSKVITMTGATTGSYFASLVINTNGVISFTPYNARSANSSITIDETFI